MEEFNEARLKAEAFIAYAPRSRAEVARRLQRSKYDEETIAKVIESLVEGGLLNDQDFANSWVESRARSKGLGKVRLSSELRRMGVDAEAVDAALEQVDTDQEVKSAWALVERKFANSDATDPAERRRAAAFLQRKGFGWSVIEQVFSIWTENSQ